MTETEKSFPHRILKYIKHLNMEKHPTDNGFFVETVRSGEKVVSDNQQRLRSKRDAYTVIYYLLTSGKKMNLVHPEHDLSSEAFIPFHSNKSDIMHYYHDGWPITYIILDPLTGDVEEKTLGPKLEEGHHLHICVGGGKFKAATINVDDTNWARFDGEIPFGLVSEQVAPGFEYEDHEIYTEDKYGDIHPHVFKKYGSLVKK